MSFVLKYDGRDFFIPDVGGSRTHVTRTSRKKSIVWVAQLGVVYTNLKFRQCFNQISGESQITTGFYRHCTWNEVWSQLPEPTVNSETTTKSEYV